MLDAVKPRATLKHRGEQKTLKEGTARISDDKDDDNYDDDGRRIYMVNFFSGFLANPKQI